MCTCSVVQKSVQDKIKSMILNKYISNGEEVVGASLLNFCRTEWLNTSCIHAGLVYLTTRYASQVVGMIGPDWYAFNDVSKEKIVLQVMEHSRVVRR